jgi:hypothetical protein
MKSYELGNLDEILHATRDKDVILVTRDGELVGDPIPGLNYVKKNPGVAYHLGCTPLIILGNYTLCARVGGVLLTKRVRDDLEKRSGTLEMRLALTPQVVDPTIAFQSDWPFTGAQALAYFFARLIPFAIVVFVVLVFVFRNQLFDLYRSFVKRF